MRPPGPDYSAAAAIAPAHSTKRAIGEMMRTDDESRALLG